MFLPYAFWRRARYRRRTGPGLGSLSLARESLRASAGCPRRTERVAAPTRHLIPFFSVSGDTVQERRLSVMMMMMMMMMMMTKIT
jgi:hypothetical protein